MHEWFVVAQFATWAMTPNGPEMIPTSVTHAKRMGDLVTACGLHCASWKRWYASPFPMRGPTCSTCLEATRSSQLPASGRHVSAFKTVPEADILRAVRPSRDARHTPGMAQ